MQMGTKLTATTGEVDRRSKRKELDDRALLIHGNGVNSDED